MIFVCISVLHLSMIEPSLNGLSMQKFVCNHPYLFESPGAAYRAGMLMNMVTLSIELSNMLVVLMSGDTLSIIGNFVALVIIAEFDNYVFASMQADSFMALLEEDFTSKIFVVRHTTSVKCQPSELTDVIDEEGNRRPLRVRWASRTCGNKCMYLIYKIQRLYFVSINFYFIPLWGMILACVIPVYFQNVNSECSNN